MRTKLTDEEMSLLERVNPFLAEEVKRVRLIERENIIKARVRSLEYYYSKVRKNKWVKEKY